MCDGDSKQAGEPQHQGPTEDLWHWHYLGCSQGFVWCSRESAASSAGAAVLLSWKSKSKQCKAHPLGRVGVRASRCSGTVTAGTAACRRCPWLYPLAPSPALGAAPPTRCAPCCSSRASVGAGSRAVATWLLLTPSAIGAGRVLQEEKLGRWGWRAGGIAGRRGSRRCARLLGWGNAEGLSLGGT